ncbi:MAG: alpha/beta fold hydrolase, partial [Pseudomonadota bacterium]
MLQGRGITAVLAIVLSAGCSDSNDSRDTPADTELTPLTSFEEHPCEISIPAGFSQEDVRCGTLTAPRDRDDPDSETLTVEFGVVLARGPDTAPDPFVYVPGGPGDPALEAFFALDALDLLKQVNQARDLVYFDPRGTGISTPDLSCPERLGNANDAVLQPGGGQEDGAARLAGLRTCNERLLAVGNNLSGYHSASIATDLVEGLRALGYEQANYWGPSYGGRVVQTLMRDYPEMTRSVILDAPAMPEIRTTEASNFQLSLNRLVEECAAAPLCSELYPDLETKFYTAVDNLNMDPAAVDIQFEGSTETVFVSGDRFVLGLQNAFNSNSLLPLIPVAIDNVAAGDLAIVQAVAPDLLTAFESISWG